MSFNLLKHYKIQPNTATSLRGDDVIKMPFTDEDGHFNKSFSKGKT